MSSKRKSFEVMFVLLVLGIFPFSLAFNIQPAKTEPTTIRVPDDYPTIQEAINAADPGDTILVAAGTYYGPINIDKSLTLKGIGENRTAVIDGKNNPYTIYITANDVAVSGFTIQNSTSAHVGLWSGIVVEDSGNTLITDNTVKDNAGGILFMDCIYSIIERNTISNNWYGISIGGGHHNTISRNTITKGHQTGISINSHYPDGYPPLVLTYNNTVIGNTITSNEVGLRIGGENNTVQDNIVTDNTKTGILLWESSGNILRNNRMTDNFFNFGVRGEELLHFVNDIDTSNKVDGKPIYYWVNQDDKQIPIDAGFVAVINSTRVVVKNVNISNNYQGILFAYTRESFIRNSNITGCNYGVYLFHADDNVIYKNFIDYDKWGHFARYSEPAINLVTSTHNVISNNTITIWGTIGAYDGALKLEIGSTENIIRGNTITNSSNGICLSSSGHNTLRQNTLTNVHPYNFIVGGRYLTDFIQDIDTSNKINGKSIYYLVNQRGLIIDSLTSPDVGYLAIINSTNITVRNLSLTENYIGVFFAYTNDSTIESVNATKNEFGIRLWYSNENIIRDNTIAYNIFRGIALEYSSRNTIHRNTIKSGTSLGFWTLVGIEIVYRSNDNIIYHNDFIGNFYKTARVYETSNTWDDGYPSGGNYWSDYTDIDEKSGPNQDQLGSDGIWDHPYIIDESNVDGYPLVNPWSPQLTEVTITGRLYYFDNENNYQPVDRALVELYDEDLEFDDLLDATYTTSDGYFVLGPVDNVDNEPGESGTRDLYIKGYAKNWAAQVKDDSATYEFRTATEWDVPDGEHDWGNMPVPEEQYPVFFILDIITSGYDYAHSFVDSFSASVNVKWYQGYDTKTRFDYLTDTIHVEGTTINPDQWDDGMILHEYGHFIGKKLSIVGPYDRLTDHQWNGTYTPELAWSEGWAHFFSSATRKSPSYRNNFASDVWVEYNVETGIKSTSYGETADGNALGGSCEASVAGILWDIYDGYSMRDDQDGDGIGDNLDDKEDAIWDVVQFYSTGGLLPHKVYTIFDFWDGWFARGHGHRQEMWDIYYEHGETMPLEERAQTFNITVEEEKFKITIVSNSTITGFNFNQTRKQVSFNVMGPAGTVGFSNVTIPDDLLWGEFTVYMDGSPLMRNIDYTQIHNGTHYIFYITYIHSTHLIEIRGSEAIEPDTTPPIISVLSPENKTYSVKDIPLTFTLNEQASWIGYSLDDQANVTITGNITITQLSESSHRSIVYAADAAGNVGASETVFFTVETKPKPFPTWIIGATIATIAIAVTTTLLTRKRKHKTPQHPSQERVSTNKKYIFTSR